MKGKLSVKEYDITYETKHPTSSSWVSNFKQIKTKKIKKWIQLFFQNSVLVNDSGDAGQNLWAKCPHTGFNSTVSLRNHSDIINSSNTASLQQPWCLGAGVTCTQHYRISRYLTQTCCGVLTLIPGPLESPVCVTLSCLIPVISQPRC